MKAQVKSYRSPDVELESYQPRAGEPFMVFIELDVGSEGERGADTFGVTVCSPSWLEASLSVGELRFVRHVAVVLEWNWPAIREALARKFESVEAPNWHELALILSRYGEWEFEDYQPMPSP